MAKQLFNSTEKSNFILNMTEEKYSKLAAWGLLAACFMTSLFTIVPECTDSGFYTLVSGGLAVAGVYCIIMALISFMKGYVEKRVMFPVISFGVIVAWGVVSLINSFDPMVSLYGFSGRGEGLLAILFYFCFFVTGISLKREGSMMIFLGGIIGTGVLNAVWGLIQVFTGALSNYKYLSIEIEAHAASGLSQSPVFLAMLLSLSLTAALMGAVLFNEKKKRILCIAAACPMALVMVFTYSLAGWCGLGFAVLAALVTVFASGSPKKRLASVLAAAVPAALGVIIVQAGLIGSLSGYKLYDGRIVWWADSYYRLSSSGEPDTSVVDLDDTFDVYYTLNKKTMNVISNYPLTGTGPEQLVYPQLYKKEIAQGAAVDDIRDIIITNKGTFDKVYNEYLYSAATRGIPSAIALCLVLLSVLILSFRNMKRKNSVTGPILFALTLCGTLIFLVGCSNTAFSPVFWSAAGAGCVELNSRIKAKDDKEKKDKKENKSQKEDKDKKAEKAKK